MQDSKLYFESHVTIEPAFDDRLAEAEKIAASHGFKLAQLLMQKRKDDTPERSKFDTFMTAKSKQFDELNDRMIAAVQSLTVGGFKVWRYKIEAVILDSKHDDIWGLL